MIEFNYQAIISIQHSQEFFKEQFLHVSQNLHDKHGFRRHKRYDLSSVFKLADVITSQIGNKRCTACEQAVNKYAIQVGQRVIRWTFFISNTCSASFNNVRLFYAQLKVAHDSARYW